MTPPIFGAVSNPLPGAPIFPNRPLNGVIVQSLILRTFDITTAVCCNEYKLPLYVWWRLVRLKMPRLISLLGRSKCEHCFIATLPASHIGHPYGSVLGLQDCSCHMHLPAVNCAYPSVNSSPSSFHAGRERHRLFQRACCRCPSRYPYHPECSPPGASRESSPD